MYIAYSSACILLGITIFDFIMHKIIITLMLVEDIDGTYIWFMLDFPSSSEPENINWLI